MLTSFNKLSRLALYKAFSMPTTKFLRFSKVSIKNMLKNKTCQEK